MTRSGPVSLPLILVGVLVFGLAATGISALLMV